MNRRRGWTVGGLFAAFILLHSIPGAAQKSTLPESVTRVSGQPSVISGQLRTAALEARRALEGYEAAGPSDPIEGPHQAASNAYVLIRAARSGMEEIRYKKKSVGGDPVLDIAYRKTTEAWNRCRAPVDRLSSGTPRTVYLSESRRQLAETIEMLEQILIIWP